MKAKQIAELAASLTPEEKKELADVHNLRILPIRIKPDGGGCTPGSCATGYYCDPQSGQCILNAGG